MVNEFASTGSSVGVLVVEQLDMRMEAARKQLTNNTVMLFIEPLLMRKFPR
jgi:hypothetical protein